MKYGVTILTYWPAQRVVQREKHMSQSTYLSQVLQIFQNQVTEKMTTENILDIIIILVNMKLGLRWVAMLALDS